MLLLALASTGDNVMLLSAYAPDMCQLLKG